MSGAGEAAELFDVDVDELARPCALVPIGGLERLEPRAPAEAIRFSTAETVESGIRSTSAISAAVIRSRRKSSITRTRSAGVREGIRWGAEERSLRPSRPSLR
jgi:hypothetical protein